MKKERIMGFVEVVVVVGVLVLCVMALGWTNQKGVEKCTNAGYSETYCKAGLK